MRVLIHAVAWAPHGGASRQLEGLLRGLAQATPHVDYLLYINDQFVPQSEYPNISLCRTSIRSELGRLIDDLVRLPRVAREQGADCIWALLGYGAVVSRVPQICFLANSALYCDGYLVRTAWHQKPRIWLRRLLQYLSLRSSPLIVTPSEAMRDLALDWFPHLGAARFAVIPHSTIGDGDRLPPAADLQLPVRPESGAHLRLAYVGRMALYKDLDFTLELLARFKQRRLLPFQYLLTIERSDNPACYDHFVQLVETLGLQDEVLITGQLEHQVVDALYQQVDLLLYPSRCESFGFPLIEAMQAGVAVVAADTPINRELGGEAVAYYPCGDLSAALEALVALAMSPARRAARGQAGKDRAAAIAIDHDEVARRCVAVTEAVLGAAGGRRRSEG